MSLGAALLLLALTTATSAALQRDETTVVQIRILDPPDVWLMDLQSPDVTWSITIGDGCGNLVPGPATLLIDGTGTSWLVLPDATPGSCHINRADLVQRVE